MAELYTAATSLESDFNQKLDIRGNSEQQQQQQQEEYPVDSRVEVLSDDEDAFVDAQDGSGVSGSISNTSNQSSSNKSSNDVVEEAAVVADHDDDSTDTADSTADADAATGEAPATADGEFLDVTKDFPTAITAKEAGNALYRNKDYDGALEEYSRAITYCPDDSEEHKETLSTFYGNRAAAYCAVEEWALAVDDCTEALLRNERYVKVVARRMQAFEKLEKYEEALADAKTLQELDPSYPKLMETTMRLQRKYEEKMNRLKDEALGKLKDLGNSILGNFGMSLDSFKMNQDPSSGSWSISMNNS